VNTRLTLSAGRGRATLAASILGSGMAFVDSTAVQVALPAIGRSLGTGFSGFQWVVNAYALTLGALILFGGSLADLRGRRRVFLTGTVVFAATSLLCAVAPSTAFLIGARGLQGIGAALLIPASLALVHVSFPEGERARAIGIWSAFSGVSALVGPVAGGWLVEALSWRAVFYLNPVVAVLVVLLALSGGPDARPPGTDRARLDMLGAATGIATLGGLVFVFIQGPEWGWRDPKLVAAGALALVSGVAFVDLERSQARPMLPVGIFRSSSLARVSVVTFLVYFVPAGTFFLLTLQLQRVLGYTAFEAGAAQAPVTLLFLTLSPLAGRWAELQGPRIPMTVGPLVGGVGVALLAGVDAASSYWTGILPGVVVFGAGMGITVPPLTSAALSALPDERAGLASGVNNAIARISQLLAIPLLPLAAGISGIGTVGGTTFSMGYGRAMWIGVGVLAGAAMAAWWSSGPGRDGPADIVHTSSRLRPGPPP